MNPLITIAMPCFGRPLRTERMLNCIAAQKMKNFELVLIGDACPDFDYMTKSEWFYEWKQRFLRGGNHLFYMNLKTNRGGHGAGAVNVAIKVARGDYFCWANNDDMLQPEHLDFYHRSIAMFENKPDQVDFVYNRTMVNGEGGFDIRDPELKFGCCGHSELVVRTSFLKSMPAHQPEYGQDWQLIEAMMAAGKGRKGNTLFPTYLVMSTPRFQEPGID